MAAAPEQTMDRRQRRSRAALEQALLTLIAQKPWAEITVEDVAAEADVARATFYAHFKDKTNLLQDATRTLIRGLTAEIGTVGPRSGTYSGDAAIAIFRHAEAHRNLYRVLLSGEGGDDCRTRVVGALERVATEVFARTAAASGRPARVPLPLAVSTVIGGLVLTLEHWLRGDFEGDPEEVALQFSQTYMQGVGWALGYEPDELEFAPSDKV